MSSEQWTPSDLWENWVEEKNQCEGCPAHVSNRQDIEGCSGIRPWYADGALADVDVVVIGHEPGTPKENGNQIDYRTKQLGDLQKSDISTVPVDAYSLESASPLFDTLNSEFNSYWTQTKKCNEIGGQSDLNEKAEAQCAGFDGNKGYLRTELQSLDPNYVVTLGKAAHKNFGRVFDVEPLGKESFSTEIARGTGIAKLRKLSVSGESFVQIPLGHPSHGIHKHTIDELDIDDSNKTKRYYEMVSEELLAIKSGQQ